MKGLKIVVEVVLCLMIAIVLVGLVQQFFLAPVAVVGSSMEDTISSSGDKVFVQKKFFSVDRGDVVVFYRTDDEDNVTTENPGNRITFSDFFNSLPFISKIPHSSEETAAAKEYVCVIKRVIGVAGDKIEIRAEGIRAYLYRNGEKVESDFPMYVKGAFSGDPRRGVTPNTWEVGEGELFVLGDNRDISYDSEEYGCIKKSQLMGKVVLAKIRGEYKRNL